MDSKIVDYLKIFLISIICMSTFYIIIIYYTDFWQLFYNTNDNYAYLDISKRILSGDFTNYETKFFWGLPLIICAVSKLLFMELNLSYLIINITSFVSTLYIIYNIFGFKTAVYFPIFSWDYMQGVVLGDTEPVFIMIFYLTLLLYNHKYIPAYVGSLATLIRPWGISLLISYFIYNIFKRKYKKIIITFIISLIIGIIYVSLTYSFTGILFGSYLGYSDDWTNDSFIGIPFYNLYNGYLLFADRPFTNLLKTLFYIILSIIVFIIVIKNIIYNDEYKVYNINYLSYFILLYTYNSPWIWGEFPRFFMPLLPIAIFHIRNILPNNYIITVLLSVISSALYSVSALGIRNIINI